jgi:hypothetical protein
MDRDWEENYWRKNIQFKEFHGNKKEKNDEAKKSKMR